MSVVDEMPVEGTVTAIDELRTWLNGKRTNRLEARGAGASTSPDKRSNMDGLTVPTNLPDVASLFQS